MKKTTIHKLSNAIGNGLWQLIPSIGNLLLSLLIVRLFSASVWGTIVSVIVVQQITNSILAWGNKDFLQRELAGNSSKFNLAFTAFFRERVILLFAVVSCVYFVGIIEKTYFIALVLLITGRFLQQGFDIIIIKERKFRFAVGLELASLVFQVLAIWILYQIATPNIQSLFMVLWLPLLLKGIISLLLFRKYFLFEKSESLYLNKSIFFAMLSITGLVHSKIDLLLVSMALDHSTLGKYQIITAFLWNIQSVALYVSSPYIHNFYRLNSNSKRNYAEMLKRIGLLIVPIGVTLMTIILQYVFKIEISFVIVCCSLVFGVMSFIYLPWIFQLNNQKQEHRVILINVCGTGLLIGMLVYANKIWGLNLESTILIVTAHQILLTLITFFAYKNSKLCLHA